MHHPYILTTMTYFEIIKSEIQREPPSEVNIAYLA